MKKIIISLIVVLTTMTALAQNQTKSDSVASPSNVVLLDQIDGRVWQVQWSQEAANRAIIPIE